MVISIDYFLGIDTGLWLENVELINIARIDLLKGYINTELDLLTTILLDNYIKNWF